MVWVEGDIYVEAVAAVLGIEPQAVTRDQRELAKIVTFGARAGRGIKPRTEEEIRREMREILVCFRPGLLFAGESKT